MNNQILAFILVPVAMIAAIWMTSSLLTIHEHQRTVYIIAAAILLLPLFLRRRLAYDFKFLMFLLIGYAVAGKGFAYLNLVEPLYIGEITLALCLIGLLVRQAGNLQLFPTAIHYTIFAFMILVGASLLFRDFSNYRMLALRDSSIAYYGLFFFCSFHMLRSEEAMVALRKVGIVMLLGWSLVTIVDFAFGAAGFHGGLRIFLFQVNPILAHFYAPHADVLFPLAATLAVVSISLLLRDKKILFLFPLGLALVSLLLGKAAGLFALIVTCGALVVFARRVEIGIFGLISGFVGGLVVAISIAMGGGEFLQSVDLLATAGQGLGESSGPTVTTSDWRLSWWGAIWNDTIRENPYFGSGLGSDISSSFLTDYYGADRATSEALSGRGARYPHNVYFTIFGRLGLVGVLFFSVYLVFVARLMYNFCTIFLRRRDYLLGDMLFFALFCSGLANAFVQATYEAPYAAIIHWVSLGYLARRVYDYRTGALSKKPVPAPAGHPLYPAIA